MTDNSQDPNKIKISLDDLNSDSVNKRVEEMQAAQKVVMVRQVGVPTKDKGSSLRAIATFSGAGLLGGIFAFALNRLTDGFLEGKSALVNNLTFTFMLAFGISLVIVLVDAVSTKSPNKIGQAAIIAVPASIALSLGIGYLTHLLYSALRENLFRDIQNLVNSGVITTEAQAVQYEISHSHLPRGIAWLFVGVIAGLTIGLSSRSGKRLLMTVLGGALGGFLGGFVFDFLPGEASAQFVGIALLGLLIGISMSLIEQVAKSQWIEIITGGMAGKQFILYKNDIVIGSAPNSDIQLIKDSAIPAQAARISTRNNQTVIESLHPGIPCNVEGQVGNRFPLFDGANIQFGSTQIRYRSKSKSDDVALGGPVVRT
jgi:hypothetical protein